MLVRPCSQQRLSLSPKATQVPIDDGWTDKGDVITAHDRMFPSLKKEGRPVTCYTVDDPRGHPTA